MRARKRESFIFLGKSDGGGGGDGKTEYNTLFHAIQQLRLNKNIFEWDETKGERRKWK